MDILEQGLTQNHILRMENQIKSAPIVFMDANVSIEVMQTVCKLCEKHHVPIFHDPTSIAKSKKIIQAKCLDKITFLKPNEHEALNMGKELYKIRKIRRYPKSLKSCVEALVNSGVKHVILTRGKDGILYATKSGRSITFKEFPALPAKIVNVTGCGDSFSGGM